MLSRTHFTNKQAQLLRYTPLSFSIAAALSAPLVYAEEDITYLDEVVVWAAKVSSSSEYLGDEDISIKQVDHLSDLLRDIPGVDVGGTHSVNQRINIRGLNETDLDIRLDGASQHANMFHHIGNLTLNSDIIKSADIQVGANSVVHGGIGGSVQFETKNARDLLRPDEEFGARLHAGYGSNDYTQGSVTLYGQLSQDIDAMIYGYTVDRGNFKDGKGVETFGADGEVQNVLIKLGWQPTDQDRLQFSYDMYRDEGDYNPRPDMSGGANDGLSQDTLIPTNYDRDTFTLSYDMDRGDALSLKAVAYRNDMNLMRDESNLTIRWPTDRLHKNNANNINTGATVTAQSFITLGNLDNQFTYGVDYNRQDSKSTYGPQPQMHEKATSSAAFIEDKIQLTDAISVTPGVRFDDFQRKAVTSDKSFNDVTWALAADYQATDELTFFISAKELFKAPELLETFIKYQNVAHLSENITHESGLNTQAGFRFQRNSGEHSFATNLTVFKTEIDDYIRTEYNSASKQYDIYNDGDVEIKGFEASVFYGYDAFSSKLSYSKSDNESIIHGTPILDSNGRSSDIGDAIGLTLDYSFYELDLYVGLTSQFVLEEDNVLTNAPVKESYSVHNLFAQWAPHQVDGLMLTFGVDNLLNEHYASHASRSGEARGFDSTDFEPGRNVKVSASYQF
ncbi:TonB-dependent siderophore receptor [Vibrio sp. Of7-15]|uniref:TonB-dependent siderophore receptor n=1 Tax=Vibrio sp. Of7-15 TaxID=2724879 RepID=UPI001EF1B5C8|nr:TonB-dependent siderophore receptor [Vibrio sp. Of7-15]MCG7496154.1 TonB-dependent siderophore receptor [Vibrio sp. Of7-15]